MGFGPTTLKHYKYPQFNRNNEHLATNPVQVEYPQAFRRVQQNLAMGAVSSLGVGSAEQAGSSDAGRLVLVFRKLMKKQVELMVIETVKKVIVPIMEDLVRKVVEEEIKSATDKFVAGSNWTDTSTATMTNGRRLRLRFKDEVSENVLTGREIKGKGDTPIRVELVDEATGQVIESGPESSARVEILFLEAGDNPNDHIPSHQDFISKIIKQGDKTKPQFSQSCHVHLDKGTGALNNAKLANAANWTKKCKCRLGAQVLDNLNGINVQEAWTEPFLVSDNRRNKYGKHKIPSLSDCAWRLVGIGKSGKRWKRLEKNNVNTVEQFLFLLSVHPQLLQEVLSTTNHAWETTVKHARTCVINDKNIYMYNDSTEGNMSVLFDAVGKLKGIIHDSHYVTENCLSEAEEDRAHKLLLSAFKNWKDSHRTFFSDEVALVQKFPYRERNDVPIASMEDDFPGIESAGFENSNHSDPTDAVDSGQSISASTQEHFQDFDPTISENINHGDPSEPGTSAQHISPCIGASGFNSDSRGKRLGRNEVLNTSVQDEIPDTDSTIFENVDYGDPTEPLSSSQRLSSSIEQSGNVNNTLVHQVPCRANDDAITGRDSTMLESVSHCNPTEPGNSAQNISPSIGPSGDANDYSHLFSFVSTHLGTESISFSGPMYSPDHRIIDMFWEYCGANGISETPGDEILSLQQCIAGRILLAGAMALRWKFQAREKRKMALGQRETNVSKRQRIESSHGEG